MASRKRLSVLLAIALFLLIVTLVIQSTTIAEDTSADNPFASSPPVAAQAVDPTDPADNPMNELMGGMGELDGAMGGPMERGIMGGEALFSAEEVQIRQIERQLAATAKRQQALLKALAEVKQRQQASDREARREYARVSGGRIILGDRGPWWASNPPSPSAGSRTTWEYKSAEFTDDDNANALGKEGWELVNVYTRQHGSERAVYKRPVDANAAQATQWDSSSAVPTNPGVPYGAPPTNPGVFQDNPGVPQGAPPTSPADEGPTTAE